MKYTSFLSLILACLLSTGCAPIKERTLAVGEKERLTIENLNIDNYFFQGPAVQVFDRVPQRVVVIGENETETLLMLGVESAIVMTMKQNSRAYAMREENKKKLANLPQAEARNLNMEYVLQQQPDLIVAQQCIFVRHRLKNTAYWNERGISTMVTPNSNSPARHVMPETVAKEMQFILDLGRIFHKEPEAHQIVDGVYHKIEQIKERTKGQVKPKVMMVENWGTMVSYDREKLVGDMVSSIGGIVSHTPSVITYEDIIKEDPDVLFVVCSRNDYGSCLPLFTENPALKDLRCVKNHRVYTVPLRYTYSTLGRTEDGLQFLAERMYPGISFGS